MNNLVRTLSLAFMVLVQQALCSGVFPTLCGAQITGERMIVVGKEQNGQTFAVAHGDLIEIQLSGMGGTGYWWYFDNFPAKCLELVSETTRPSSRGGKLGGPVTGFWRLRAFNEGETQIKMDYYRAWEGKDKSKDHFIVKIDICNEKRR